MGIGLVDVADAAGHLLKRLGGALHRLLDVLHLRGNVFGRLRGLAGELFDPLATAGKARAASPARTASMLALSARSEVWRATVWIKTTTSPMRVAVSASPPAPFRRRGQDRWRQARSPPWRRRCRRTSGECGSEFRAPVRHHSDVGGSSFRRVGGGRHLHMHVAVATARSPAVLPMRWLPAVNALMTSSTAPRKRRVKKLRPA